MWKTISYHENGKPRLDVNEQGVVYSYRTKKLLKMQHLQRKTHRYLYWNDGNVKYYLHREVAKAFPEICGEWFDGCEVHHKDGNPLNNEASNLIVCSKEEHVRLHRLLKEKKSKQRKVVDFQEKLKEFQDSGEFTIHFYCRKSKQDKNGLSPIELYIYKDYERYAKCIGLKENPVDFENGKHTIEFLNFLNKINYEIKSDSFNQLLLPGYQSR